MTVNGEPRKVENATSEPSLDEPNLTSKLFHDSSREIDSISEDLYQKNFFRLSWKGVDNDLVSVSCNKDCAIIVVAWEHSSRQENLIPLLEHQDWILKEEQEVVWKDYDWSWSRDVYGKSKAVLAKKIEGGATLTFNRPVNDLPVSVFVVQGIKIINFKLCAMFG